MVEKILEKAKKKADAAEVYFTETINNSIVFESGILKMSKEKVFPVQYFVLLKRGVLDSLPQQTRTVSKTWLKMPVLIPVMESKHLLFFR